MLAGIEESALRLLLIASLLAFGCESSASLTYQSCRSAEQCVFSGQPHSLTGCVYDKACVQHACKLFGGRLNFLDATLAQTSLSPGRDLDLDVREQSRMGSRPENSNVQVRVTSRKKRLRVSCFTTPTDKSTQLFRFSHSPSVPWLPLCTYCALSS